MYVQVQPKYLERQPKRKSQGLKWLKGIGLYIKNYFTESCIHGFAYLVRARLTLAEHIFWFVLIIVSVGMCIYTGLQAMDRWENKSTVMGMARDYYFWRTPVPSFTVCPMRRLSQELFDKYCHKKKITGQPKEDLQIFLETLANSTYVNFANITVRPSIENTLDRLRLRPAQYMSLIYNLTSDFTQMEDENERIRLNDGFRNFVVRQVLTEFGICYLGNSYLHNEYTARYTIFGKFPKINKEHFKMLLGSYFDNVLMILSVPKTFESIGVFIHSAHDALKIEQKFFYTNEAVYYKAETREIVAEEGFEKATTVAQRQCRFPHESNLEHFEIYTKSFCMQECRINLVYKKCKCIPHFYPNRIKKPKPVCSYTTLKSCVAKNAEFFRRLHSSKARKTVHCHCMDSCYNSIVVIKNVEVLANLNIFQTGFTVGLEVTTWPLELLKRQVIFTFTDLLVSVGGAAGLFLGFSVLGAIEFFYYFTLRLIWYLRGYRT